MKTSTATLSSLVILLGVISWNQRRTIHDLQNEAAGVESRNLSLKAEVAAIRRTISASDKGLIQQKDVYAHPSEVSGSLFEGPLGNLKLLTEAKDRGLVQPPPYFSPYGLFFEFPITFVKVFALTSEEVSTLKSHMSDAQTKIDAMILSNATVLRDEKGLIITINPTAEGASVHDDLLAAFRTTLGEERYRFFLQLAGDQFERSLGYFGAQGRTITIKRNTVGPSQYTWEEQIKSLSGGPGNFRRSGTISNRQHLEIQFRAVATLFPHDL